MSCVIAVLVACSGGARSSDVAALRRRPLVLPSLTAGQPCPADSVVSQPTPGLGQMLGNAPVRPVFGTGATMAFAPAKNYGSAIWGGNKVIWAVAPDVRTDVLIRGHQLDGDSDIRFNYGDAELLPDLVLDVSRTASSISGGWRDFPTATRVQRPGCYAIQIDSADRSDVLVFLVI